MSPAEAYRELERDREALSRWWSHQMDRLRRQMIKSDRTTFPRAYGYTYTSPRRNCYLINCFISDKRMRDFGSICVAVDGMTAYISWINEYNGKKPHREVIMPHAWKRYGERMQFEETGKALIRKFFCRNFGCSGTRNQAVEARSLRYNGEEHVAMCMDDGVLLGIMEEDIFVGRTFITYEMAGTLQREEFDRVQHRRESPALMVPLYKRYLPVPELQGPTIPKKLLEQAAGGKM